MPDNKSTKHQLPLIGKKVKLCIFNRKHVDNEYINSLNGSQVDILYFAKFDNDGLINVLQ